ncbi:MAG: hypothetical protein K0R66_1423 [Gammaproteobacteria bacterium]|jgi:hypothetical protein|nr:hypothetical protein [Gammaproteobacteria bacterium]
MCRFGSEMKTEKPVIEKAKAAEASAAERAAVMKALERDTRNSHHPARPGESLVAFAMRFEAAAKAKPAEGRMPSTHL